jgi:large conductance mechanosensitive channel
MIQEFKKFALRGNMIELAVAVILGLAFNAVVQSLVDDILLNLIAAAVGEPDFSELSYQLGDATIRYGAFLTALINFFLVAFALFLVVRAMNRLMGKEDEPPKMAECPFCKTSIPVNATRCPSCTSPIEPQPV